MTLPTRRIGLLAALLALFGQLLLGIAVPRELPDPVLAQLLGGDADAICHVDFGGGSQPSHSGHGPADCLLCPLCATLAHHIVLPAPPVPLPTPRMVLVRVAMPVRPAAAAPAVPRQAAEPRGPPSLA